MGGKKRLRSGFTTGSCSAAAAKAAVQALVTGSCPTSIEIPFPDGSRYRFPVKSCSLRGDCASASIIKDAGDDPDVTNGAEISAQAIFLQNEGNSSGKDCICLDTIQLCRGEGVGYITKPGLAIPPGEPAINPVPRKMITESVLEVTQKPVKLTISIANGKALAEKTLNHRLGILDGLSVLGTTGIVRPVSADAWTATIAASMDVARKAGLDEIVLSTGRTSESGVQKLLDLQIEAYAMMGDYLEFSLKEASAKGFNTIHLAGMWAKIMKAALRVPQTHVRNGVLEMKDAARLLASLGASGKLFEQIQKANSAREMLTHIERYGKPELIEAVCKKAKDFAEEISGVPVQIYLINHKAEIITHV